MQTSLSFQGTSFDVIDQNGQPWLQARQIGKALGYSRSDAVLNLYDRNKDEFLPTMTRTIELMVGGQDSEIRIFSLRGCHLLAMFARTPVAKEFRVWVLDVLETLPAPQHPLPSLPRLSLPSDPERKALNKLVKVWGSLAGADADPGVWPRINTQVAAHFCKTTVDDMTVEEVREAIKWVQSKIDAVQVAPKPLPLPSSSGLPSPADMLVSADPADRIEAHFLRIRSLIREIHELERELYTIVKQHRGDVLNRFDARRSLFVTMNAVLERQIHSLDYALEALENHAKSMCVLSGI